MIDTDKLVQAALETECSPLAIEQGTELAEAWIGRGEGADRHIIAVECGFVMWLGSDTVIVGVQDLLTEELFPVCDLSLEERLEMGRSTGVYSAIVGNEWKTTKEASKYWNESKWLDGITEGSQISIYALALMSGTYYPKVGAPIQPGVREPRIRVKAISKSTPPCVWPRREEDGVITFSSARLDNMRDALMSKADAIRMMRKREGIWQVPGIWCTNQFRRLCEHHEDCVTQRPHQTVGGMQESDPAFRLAVPHIGDRVNDPELVILSASGYSKVCECPEAYRRSLGGVGESSGAMDTGTVFHSVIAEYYRQLKEEQDGRID